MNNRNKMSRSKLVGTQNLEANFRQNLTETVALSAVSKNRKFTRECI